MSQPRAIGLIAVERVQTGVRMEKRLLKVLKALADFKDMSLGDLLEGIVLHAFEGKAPFSEDTLARVADLRNVFGLSLDASHAHRMQEGDHAQRRRPGRGVRGRDASE